MNASFLPHWHWHVTDVCQHAQDVPLHLVYVMLHEHPTLHTKFTLTFCSKYKELFMKQPKKTPENWPHVVPQVAMSKSKQQNSVSNQVLNMLSTRQSESLGCVPEEVTWGRQATLIKVNSLFIHGTDILDRVQHTKHKEKNTYLDRRRTFVIKQRANRAGAHVPPLQWERRAQQSSPGSLQLERLSTLSHLLVLQMCSRRSSFKWQERQVWHLLASMITNTASGAENTLCAARVNNAEARQG